MESDRSAVEAVRRGSTSGVLLLVATSLGLTAVQARAAPSRAGVMTGGRVRALLREGPVTLNNEQVVGTLDLRPLHSVRWPFVCRDCTFYGDVTASGVVLERTFDLSGSIVRGIVDFGQSRFRGPALFGTPPASPSQNTLFSGAVNFELAGFDGLVTFERATFKRAANFSLARFRTDAIFAEAEFKAPVVFERSQFATADFRETHFDAGGNFRRTRFGGRADFSQSLYARTADFSDSRFGGDASFRGALFVGGRSGSSPYSATFEGASSGGSLIFNFATFSNQASFARTTAVSSISFQQATLPPQPVLVMDEIGARDLFISVPNVLHSVQPTDQQAVLGLLETTAQARGDLGVANDALYAKRVLISRGYPLPQRLLDAVFYRGVAGYLVRPFRPLAALATLAAVITLIRFVASKGSPKAEPATNARRGIARYLHDYLDTLELAGRSKVDATGRRLEVVVYRVLLVCALVGLANSNPTLRQMINALH